MQIYSKKVNVFDWFKHWNDFLAVLANIWSDIPEKYITR